MPKTINLLITHTKEMEKSFPLQGQDVEAGSV
jgi:hypothetical protein